MATTPTNHELPLPNTSKKLKVEVSLVPGDELPADDKRRTNVARVELGGKEFFAVVGKTNLTE